MLKQIFVLATIVFLTSAGGIEYLAFDLEFHWSLNTDESTGEPSVTFELWAPSTYTSVFGWVGVSLQDVLYPMDSFKCDEYIALTSDGIMIDRYAESNGYSLTDVEQGCTNDIVAWSEVKDDYTVYYWSRLLETKDQCDIVLTKYWPYMVKYAMGSVINGEIEIHSTKYMSYEYFILKDDYVDNNDDEQGVYGPWWYSERVTGSN